ncbi:MAG: winged helix-turn-helix transcriptional regulator [Solirubrobacteraceae bacterium]
MATLRSYQDACPIARSLDVVGERWALLVVRELLLGPQRYSDLRRALPGVSTNLLTDRLHELDDRGVLRRHRLPPPAASTVYELTDRGRQLTGVLDALGAWGAELPRPTGTTSLSATSVLLFLRGCLAASVSSAGVYRFQLDDRVWTVNADANPPEITPGEPTHSRAGLRADPITLNSIIARPDRLDAEIEAGSVAASGDLATLRRLLSTAAEGARVPSR